MKVNNFQNNFQGLKLLCIFYINRLYMKLSKLNINNVHLHWLMPWSAPVSGPSSIFKLFMSFLVREVAALCCFRRSFRSPLDFNFLRL